VATLWYIVRVRQDETLKQGNAKMNELKNYFSDSEIALMSNDEKASMIYGISQGFDPSDVASSDYVQTTDDCDWVF
jgi:hypothetical protein